jgi:glyoxylase-like metal-dependent hydrolase (beta-lactamase superfamily II)
MKIIPLSEGSFTIDKTKLFVPFAEGEDDLQARPVGSLLVEVQPFVVITPTDTLLLDTGLGFSEPNGKMQVHSNLEKAGIDPASITKVLMSHLHKDHAGGISEDSDRNKLCFPKATYYIQEREFKFALEKGMPSFIPEELEVLRNSPQVEWLTQDNGRIDEYIKYEVTGAHSPYHQVFHIEADNEIIFFGADDAPQLQQMKHRFVAKYDYDGKRAMELRRKWWEEGGGWTFLFYHDIASAVFRK